MKWYRKAAEQNFAEAQLCLGNGYARGNGVAKDEIEAAKLFRKAAEQNLPDAQCNLGVSYAYGLGVPKDYAEGYKWILLAAAKNSEHAKKFMPVLENMISPEQIAEGQKLAREFKPHKKSGSDNSTSPSNLTASGTGFFITEDGYLITRGCSESHLVKVWICWQKCIFSLRLIFQAAVPIPTGAVANQPATRVRSACPARPRCATTRRCPSTNSSARPGAGC